MSLGKLWHHGVAEWSDVGYRLYRQYLSQYPISILQPHISTHYWGLVRVPCCPPVANLGGTFKSFWNLPSGGPRGQTFCLVSSNTWIGPRIGSLQIHMACLCIVNHHMFWVSLTFLIQGDNNEVSFKVRHVTLCNLRSRNDICMLPGNHTKHPPVRSPLWDHFLELTSSFDIFMKTVSYFFQPRVFSRSPTTCLDPS